jgi:trehalose 6-phosphate synthase/phosphatase
MSKIIFVSNRLPYHIASGENGYESRLSVSGLVSGVQAIFKEHEGIWIGWSGEVAENLDRVGHLIDEWEKDGYYAVDIPSGLLVQAHESFNNRSLWSLFHYFIDFIDFKREDWEAYKRYNQLFADNILGHYESGDTVFINDFQLMLVPSLLRKVIPDIKISYFHHITFPTSDIFERLPVAKELIEGLLGADYIGFHTQGHVKAFERSVKRLGLELGRTRTDVNPIGVDVNFWEECLKRPETQATAKFYKSCFGKKKIILATERLDYTKGIKERIAAFDYLLETYPELRKKVTLVQVAVHSRLETPLYETIGEEVDRAVGKLNGKYGTLDWQPIHYSNRGFTQEELCALYSVSEVGCVTPLIDGLNLVSKEYVLSGSNKRSLILSKFAGAADELKDAIIVNPYDIEEVGEAMYTALHTSNVGKLKPVVKSNTIFDWANKLLSS